MSHEPTAISADSEPQPHTAAPMAHTLLRFVLAVRYRKNVVLLAMAAAAVLGGLYYTTATRYYGAKAAMLITQTGPNALDTSMTGEESQRRNTMPTYENLMRSAKVLEGALQKLGPADLIDLQDVPKDRRLPAFRSMVAAKVARATSILEVSYRSKDPRVAVHVVQAIVDSYLEFMDKMHKSTSQEISDVLTKERNETAEKLVSLQQELLEARRQFSDMGFRNEGRAMHPTVQRAVFFNEALIAVQKQAVECQSSLAAVDAAVRNGEDLGQHLIAAADIVGREVVLGSLGLGAGDSATQSALEQGLLNDVAQLGALQQHLGPKHPDVLALQERIRLAEAFLRGSPERVQERVTAVRSNQLGPWLTQVLRQRLDETRRREKIMQANFEEARAQAIDLTGQLAQVENLERDIKRLNDLNDVLLNQIASIDLKKSGQDVRVAVTEEPVVCESPVSPRLTYVALAVLLGGFAAGLLAVQVLDTLDDRFRSVEELQSRLGVPVMALVRQLPAQELAGLPGVVACAAPTSDEAEGFRTLRTALALTHPDARHLVITSAEPGDGKTTLLANLAVCYAQADRKTLLIDADLRRPGLTALLNLRGPRGLAAVLNNDGDVAQAALEHIQASGVPGLDVLASGPRPTDPARLFGDPRFAELLAWAATIYDQILIDSPPALTTSDTAIIGRLVDGVLLVVQPAKNRRRLVTRVVDSLTMMKIPLLGLVVNRVGGNDDRGYYGYHGDYGYGVGYTPGYGSAEEHVQDERPEEVGAPLAAQPDAATTYAVQPRVLTVPRRVA
jgi:polysaccharide biosynthesis transport protein